MKLLPVCFGIFGAFFYLVFCFIFFLGKLGNSPVFSKPVILGLLPPFIPIGLQQELLVPAFPGIGVREHWLSPRCCRAVKAAADRGCLCSNEKRSTQLPISML